MQRAESDSEKDLRESAANVGDGTSQALLLSPRKQAFVTGARPIESASGAKIKSQRRRPAESAVANAHRITRAQQQAGERARSMAGSVILCSVGLQAPKMMQARRGV
ncbi:MAG: hypothetical protein C0485_17035 [Pirellula sp.]|nr:hypothetical protein [Pirellula sp.]